LINIWSRGGEWAIYKEEKGRRLRRRERDEERRCMGAGGFHA
jgi:hypothetical protein